MTDIYCARCGEYLGQRGWMSPYTHARLEECIEYLRTRIEQLERASV